MNRMTHDVYEVTVAYDEDPERLQGEIMNLRDVITFQAAPSKNRKSPTPASSWFTLTHPSTPIPRFPLAPDRQHKHRVRPSDKAVQRDIPLLIPPDHQFPLPTPNRPSDQRRMRQDINRLDNTSNPRWPVCHLEPLHMRQEPFKILQNPRREFNPRHDQPLIFRAAGRGGASPLDRASSQAFASSHDTDSSIAAHRASARSWNASSRSARSTVRAIASTMNAWAVLPSRWASKATRAFRSSSRRMVVVAIGVSLPARSLL